MEGLSSRGQNGESARVDRLPIEDDTSTPVMIFLIVAGPVFCEPVCSFYRRAGHTQLIVMCGKDRAFFLRGNGVLAQLPVGWRRCTPRRHTFWWADFPGLHLFIGSREFYLFGT